MRKDIRGRGIWESHVAGPWGMGEDSETGMIQDTCAETITFHSQSKIPLWHNSPLNFRTHLQWELIQGCIYLIIVPPLSPHTEPLGILSTENIWSYFIINWSQRPEGQQRSQLTGRGTKTKKFVVTLMSLLDGLTKASGTYGDGTYSSKLWADSKDNVTFQDHYSFGPFSQSTVQPPSQNSCCLLMPPGDNGHIFSNPWATLNLTEVYWLLSS